MTSVWQRNRISLPFGNARRVPNRCGLSSWGVTRGGHSDCAVLRNCLHEGRKTGASAHAPKCSLTRLCSCRSRGSAQFHTRAQRVDAAQHPQPNFASLSVEAAPRARVRLESLTYGLPSPNSPRVGGATSTAHSAEFWGYPATVVVAELPRVQTARRPPRDRLNSGECSDEHRPTKLSRITSRRRSSDTTCRRRE